MATKGMKDSAKAIFKYLQGTFGTWVNKQQIADATHLSVSTVTGTINGRYGLVAKGFAQEDLREEVVNAESGQTKVVRYVQLTDAGMDFDPDAVVAEAPAAE